MVCPLKVLDARLEYKLKSLAKHRKICKSLMIDIKQIEDEKSNAYLRLMNVRSY